MSESGWGEDVKIENPFGLGFFSNTAVSNLIEIHTGNQKATFDVTKCIEERNVNIESETTEEILDGFELKLSNIDDSIYSYEIRERVYKIAKYLHDINVFFNGIEVKKEDFLETKNYDIEYKVKHEDFIGVLGAYEYSWGENVEIFYKGRTVDTISVPYIKGSLHIYDRVLDLTAPDRKNIIDNSKLSTFKDNIKIYFSKHLSDDIASNNIETSVMTKYEKCVGHHCNIEMLSDKVKLSVFHPNDEEHFKYLRDFIDFNRKDKSNQITLVEFDKVMKEKLHKNNCEGFQGSLDTVPSNKAIGIQEHSTYISDGVFSKDPYHPEEELAPAETVYSNQEIKERKDQIGFYVWAKDAVKYEEQIKLIKHYDIFLVILHNSIEEKIAKHCGVYSIESLSEEIVIDVHIKNTRLNSKEKRALDILNFITNRIGEGSLFRLGDLRPIKIHKIKDLDIEGREEIDKVPFIYSKKDNLIYVDRRYLNMSKLRNKTLDKLTLTDYKFIMSNFKEIGKVLGKLKIKNSELSSKSGEQLLLEVFAQ